jgi:DNA polymerase phi
VLLTLAVDVDKTQKMPGVASDGEFWVSKALATIEMLENDTKHVTLLEDVDAEDQRVRTLARHVVDTLKQVPANQQEAVKGAELLLLASVLHQYSADNEGTKTDVLEVGMVSNTLESPNADNLPGLCRRYDPYVCLWEQKGQEITEIVRSCRCSARF